MRPIQPLISFITINYNQLDVSCEMLDSVRKLSYPNFEVIFIDNASKESPQQYIETHYPEVHFIRSETNLGFSGGNNLGIKAAKGDFLFFINNDTVLADGLVEQLVQLFEAIPNLGIVSPLIRYFPGKETEGKNIIQYAGTTEVNSYTARNSTIGVGEEDLGQYKEAVPTPYVHGAAMMVPKEVIEKVGMMPESFFLYYEELDWCEQIRRAGYQIYVEQRANIYHKESVSVGKMSTLKTYYLTRNRIFFMRRNRSGFQVFLFAMFLLFFTIPKNVLLYLVKGEFDHLKAFLRGVWWNITKQDQLLPANGKAINTFLVPSKSKN